MSTDKPLDASSSSPDDRKSAQRTPCRIDGYTMWYRLVEERGRFMCRRCHRTAEFSRVIYKRRKDGTATYDITGYCGRHLPPSAPETLQEAHCGQDRRP